MIGIAATAIIIIAMSVLASIMVEGWASRDVALRARLVFLAVHDQVAASVGDKSGANLVPFFDRIAEDERVLALGFCSATGKLELATSALPASLKCGNLPLGVSDTQSKLSAAGRTLRVSIFPMVAGKVSGHLLVIHDLSFIEKRVRKARLYTTLALIGAAAGFALLTFSVVLALTRGWTRSMRSFIAEFRRGGPTPCAEQGAFPVSKEISALLTELRVERKFANGIHVEWSPQTLHQLLEDEMPGAQVLIVSNREPYIHNRVDGEVQLQIPASGLVSALEPVMRACGGTWIAHGSGSADQETVDGHDRIRVPPADPTYTLRRVWLSEEEQDGYYYGFANEGLWPLCHIAFVRPNFREQDWIHYKAVNERFADTVVQEATCDDPIVLVQDYHFALLPRMIRKRLPKATIITFWHIPWPNPETFSICPWREEIMDGLLGSSILGFHTQFHCNNFLEATDRFMESRIDRENSSVSLGGHETLIRPYPISIEGPPAALAAQAPVAECRAAVRRRFGLPDDVRIAVGVERFDYTKGILDRMLAVDDLLSRQPEWRGKFVLLQVAAPTRGKLDAYSALQTEAVRLAEEINARYEGCGCKPIQLVIRHHEPHQVFELFRAADMCVVSSLHDGMNLVAKEFVAARDDNAGVLILSSFAGASRELSEALIINPYDTHGMAEGFASALRMPPEEQGNRIRLMRDQIRQRNVYRWAAQMLLDAAWLRRREGIVVAAKN
ncbi:alpha,alpha-trehalose-phosphate synthase (UDP-forming) [Rhodoblastus sp.]|uniref:alpha,alpha-trehalose-phosphate synthase (UDP-forming) n=1 Tax=Rhodoblastus sp. TaxID=1962975 RepID=UPI003F9A3768